MNQGLILLEKPNPFEQRILRSELPIIAEQPLSHYLVKNDTSVVTLLDGVLIEPERRTIIIPGPGQQLVVTPYVGGSGGGGKGILRALSMMAVIAISIAAVYVLGPGASDLCLGLISHGWAMAVGAAISMGGSLLVNALLPPQTPSTNNTQNYGWNGAQMTAQEGLCIPVQGGMLRRSGNVIDSYLSDGFTQQWLNILIDFGWGPAASISEIEINGNPISNYPGIWTDVRLGHNEQAPLTYFSQIVNSYSQNVRLRSGDGGFTVIGTGTQTQGVEVEFTFPEGIWYQDQPLHEHNVNIQLSYRLVGELDWTDVLLPRTTGGVPLNSTGQQPWWIAVTSQWSPNQTNTMYVLAVSYGQSDHKVGDSYTETIAAPLCDANGNLTGTTNITVTGSWQINPLGPGASSTSTPGVNYVMISDYKNVSQNVSWDHNVLCRAYIRVDNLPAGQYEYKVQKLNSSHGGTWDSYGEDNSNYGELCTFTDLREIQYDTLAYPNKILLAIRALATDKLSGSNLNVTAVIDKAASPSMGYKNEIAYDLPAAYYRMNDSAGTACADLTAHGHDGAYVGAPVKSQPGLIAGSPDNAVMFANGQAITIASPVSFPATSGGAVSGAAGWAVELWVSVPALSGTSTSTPLVSSADGSTYMALVGDGRVNFHCNGADHFSTAAIVNGGAHHIACGATPGGFLMMIDGAPQFFPALATPAWTAAKLAGTFVGTMDEVAFYTYAIQPGRLKSHYQTGTAGIHSALEDRRADNPAMVMIDGLLNPLYGGQQSPALLNPISAWEEYADFNDELVSDGEGGQIYRHIFNGVFDKQESLWQAMAKVGTMSRTVLMRSGVGYTVACEAPATRSQIFTMGNIKLDSFKETWPGLMDRANTVAGSFLDETNNWKETPLRVMNEAVIAAGAPLQDAGTVDLFGITNPRAAWRELTYRLLASQSGLPTLQLDCALEGLAARLGDVVGVQHDVPQWGAGGRTLDADSASSIRLDQPVTIAAGISYVLMLAMPAVQRASGTLQTIAGNLAVLQTSWDGTGVAKRLVCSGIDSEITEVTLSAGLAYLTLATEPALVVGAACKLYDVDVLETCAVANAPGTTDVIVTSSPFSCTPPEYSLYFFGQLSDIQDFRITAIGRRSDQEMTLQLSKYDPTIYGDLEPVLPIAPVNADLVSVTALVLAEAPNSTPQYPVINVTWKPGKLTAGVRLYLAVGSLAEYLVADIKGANFAQVSSVSSGQTYTIRAVGYDAGGYAAPYATAPVAGITPVGVALLPANVTGFFCSACSASSVTLGWTLNPSTDNIDHYEIRFGGTVVNPVWGFATPLTPNPVPAATSATFASGAGSYMIVAVNASGVASALPMTVAASSTTVTTSGSGGGGTGDGGTGCFTGNVAIDTPEGWTDFAILPIGRPFEIINETGTHLAELLVHDVDEEMIDFTGFGHLVTLYHLMKLGIAWVPASEFYASRPRAHFTGKVYNLHVLSANPADKHYRLRNGDIAHNMKMAPTIGAY